MINIAYEYVPIASSLSFSVLVLGGNGILRRNRYTSHGCAGGAIFGKINLQGCSAVSREARRDPTGDRRHPDPYRHNPVRLTKLPSWSRLNAGEAVVRNLREVCRVAQVPWCAGCALSAVRRLGLRFHDGFSPPPLWWTACSRFAGWTNWTKTCGPGCPICIRN